MILRHTRIAVLLRCMMVAFVIFVAGCTSVVPVNVSFAQSASAIDAYDFVEVTANVTWPRARNPFTDASFTGWFESVKDGRRWQVEGFCDSADGSVFRIRFMPPTPGDYKYFVEYKQGRGLTTTTRNYQASNGHRRGPIRVDTQ